MGISLWSRKGQRRMGIALGRNRVGLAIIDGRGGCSPTFIASHPYDESQPASIKSCLQHLGREAGKLPSRAIVALPPGAAQERMIPAGTRKEFKAAIAAVLKDQIHATEYDCMHLGGSQGGASLLVSAEKEQVQKAMRAAASLGIQPARIIPSFVASLATSEHLAEFPNTLLLDATDRHRLSLWVQDQGEMRMHREVLLNPNSPGEFWREVEEEALRTLAYYRERTGGRQIDHLLIQCPSDDDVLRVDQGLATVKSIVEQVQAFPPVCDDDLEATQAARVASLPVDTMLPNLLPRRNRNRGLQRTVAALALGAIALLGFTGHRAIADLQDCHDQREAQMVRFSPLAASAEYVQLAEATGELDRRRQRATERITQLMSVEEQHYDLGPLLLKCFQTMPEALTIRELRYTAGTRESPQPILKLSGSALIDYSLSQSPLDEWLTALRADESDLKVQLSLNHALSQSMGGRPTICLEPVTITIQPRFESALQPIIEDLALLPEEDDL